MHRRPILYYLRLLFLAGVLFPLLSACQSSAPVGEASSPDENILDETFEEDSGLLLDQGPDNPEIVLPAEQDDPVPEATGADQGAVEEIFTEEALSEELLQTVSPKSFKKEPPVKGPLKNEIETMVPKLLPGTEELPAEIEKVPVMTEDFSVIEDVPDIEEKTPKKEEQLSEVTVAPVEEDIPAEKEIPSAVEDVSPVDENMVSEEAETPYEESVDTGASSQQKFLLPSELVEIPVNPLLDLLPSADSESEDMPSGEPDASEEPVDGRDKYEILEEEESAQAVTITEPVSQPDDILMDRDAYSVALDHLERLVLSLDGSGWIFLSVLSPDSSSLYLLDKSYDPVEGRTNFVFRRKGDPDHLELSVLKQDLFSGENRKYIVTVEQSSFKETQETSTEEAEVVQEAPLRAISRAEERDPETEDVSVSPLVSSEPQNASNGKGNSLPDVNALSAEELLVLAEKCEKPGPEQSLEQAREYYMLILDKYPVTLERFEAEDRLRYLDRHYFKVQ